MEKEKLQIIAKLGIDCARHQLEAIATQVKIKNPSHEMIETNLTIVKDLLFAKKYIVELEHDLDVSREVQMNYFRLSEERRKEVEELKRQIKELQELL
jgi:hypothetical protein